ncbi:hypothetical protein CARUB_v10012565mg [Capsella rubella]|uniref:BED-type domain-containing protein n=1 Tax=Capsella rubella TaxID=81985 RepID=R0IH84_9BRAS|nr:hypothetical protein CARUB_v10012565mg [Capsella rubella]
MNHEADQNHEEEQDINCTGQQAAVTTKVLETPDCSGKRKDIPESSVANAKPAKEFKVILSRSPVWDHFTRNKEDRNKCICHYYKKEYCRKYKSGTSNLTMHMATCNQYQAYKENKSQQVIKGNGTVQSGKISEPLFREATNEMLVLGELPLSFVDNVAWRHFSSHANLYRPHTKRTASRDIVHIASYLVITTHFIDAFWLLKKLIIGFKYVSNHKASTIATTLLDCLAEWGIQKVFAIIVDIATTNTLALKMFHRELSLVSNEAFFFDGDYMHVRCSAHIINLIVRDGLQELGKNVKAIRNGVSYVRSSHVRQKSFKLRVDSGKLKRGSLTLDVKTIWNSTYTMLTNAVKYKFSFVKMLLEDRLFHDYFQELDNGNRRVGPPESTEWNAIERLVKFLVIFYNSTLVVSASTNLHAHKCYGEIVTIERNHSFLSSSPDDELKNKADEMLKKFVKYWDGMKNNNKMLIIATICFEKLYGEDTIDSIAMLDSVFYVLDSMYKEYAALYSPRNCASSQTTRAKQHHSTQIREKMDLVDDLGYKRMDMAYKEMVADKADEEVRRELKIYLTYPVENPKLIRGTELDVLSWWRVNSFKYPVLAEMVKDVLAMQVSSVASESAFSTSGRILDPHRSCLTHYMIEVLMCTEQWMRQDIKSGADPTVITSAQLLSEFEMFDQLEKGNL